MINHTEGFWGVQKYWQPFEAYAVERLLAEHHNCIIDFGAGHSVYEHHVLFFMTNDTAMKCNVPNIDIWLLSEI